MADIRLRFVITCVASMFVMCGTDNATVIGMVEYVPIASVFEIHVVEMDAQPFIIPNMEFIIPSHRQRYEIVTIASP